MTAQVRRGPGGGRGALSDRPEGEGPRRAELGGVRAELPPERSPFPPEPRRRGEVCGDSVPARGGGRCPLRSGFPELVSPPRVQNPMALPGRESKAERVYFAWGFRPPPAAAVCQHTRGCRGGGGGRGGDSGGGVSVGAGGGAAQRTPGVFRAGDIPAAAARRRSAEPPACELQLRSFLECFFENSLLCGHLNRALFSPPRTSLARCPKSCCGVFNFTKV